MEGLLKSLTQKQLRRVEPNEHHERELTLDDGCKHIVIGSGMGGGMVARQLIENGKKVALFEKGEVPFSTHCLNTSRPHFSSRSSNHTGLDNELVFQDKQPDDHTTNRGATAWVDDHDRKVIRTPYDTQEECGGGSVFALGGRSLLWSLEAPEMDLQTARRYFPPDVIDYLYGLAGPRAGAWGGPNERESGYAKAMRIMANSPPGDPQYPLHQLMTEHLPTVEFPIDLRQSNLTQPTPRSATDAAIHNLRRVEQLKDSDIFPTPIGAEFTRGDKLHYFPQSAYSTVDYLLHHGLDPTSDLTLFVGIPAFKLEIEDGKVSKIVLKPDGEIVVNVQDKDVILCAGTVNTAAIARRSNLQRELNNNLIGSGLTDHEIWRSRCWKLYTDDEKRQDHQPVELSCYVPVHNSQAFLTVCTHAEKFFSRDFADGSGLSKANTPPANCLNITLQFDAELNNAGEVDCQNGDPTVKINRNRLDETGEFHTAVGKLFDDIRTAFGFPIQASQDIPLLQPFGSLAQEVGTMRMGKDEMPTTPERSEVPHDTPSENTGTENRTSSESGVVNKDLKVHNLENLYVCDLSVFPFSPAANPSLTLTALAMRLGDYLAKKDSG